MQATAKEYGTTYGTTHEEEEDENDIRLETAADREALRSSDAFYNDNIPAPQVCTITFTICMYLHCLIILILLYMRLPHFLCPLCIDIQMSSYIRPFPLSAAAGVSV